MGPTWGQPGYCLPQVGPMLAPWTLLSGFVCRTSSTPSTSKSPNVVIVADVLVPDSHQAVCKDNLDLAVFYMYDHRNAISQYTYRSTALNIFSMKFGGSKWWFEFHRWVRFLTDNAAWALPPNAFMHLVPRRVIWSFSSYLDLRVVRLTVEIFIHSPHFRLWGRITEKHSTSDGDGRKESVKRKDCDEFALNGQFR